MKHPVWKAVPIRDLYEGLYDGPHATPKPSADGPIFLGIKNVTDDGRLDFSDIRHIAEDDYASWTKRVEPQAGDLVFTYEATLNRYAILPNGFRGCLGRRLALIRPDHEKADSRFLFYYFFGEAWRNVIAKNMLSGATVDRIPLTHFPDFPVHAPPLHTQRKIAAILSAYDDLIANNLRRIKIIEEMARSLYREWFVNFRFPGHQKVRMVNSPLGKIPEGWEVRQLEEVTSRITDGSHWSPKAATGGFPMASVKDMHDWGIDTSLCRTIGEEDFRELVRNDCKPLKGDVLIAKDGSFLKHSFVVDKEEEVVILSSIAILRPSHVISPHYLNSYLQLPHVKERLKGCVSGVAIPRIVLQDFRKFPVLLPSNDVQRMWVDKAESMILLCLKLTDRNHVLKTTRDLLLPKLISGDLDVSKLDIKLREKSA